MVQLMPQEIEVRYLLPAIRRELTQELIFNHNLKQREVAQILGVTESAISQYVSDKRGSELQFNAKEKKIIKTFAQKIAVDQGNSLRYMFNVSQVLRGSKSMCDLHREIDGSIPKKCDICKES
ncbi:MAG: transcriptional regulator [Candidatus Woesearchaeota archaeon]